jgi:hypothetical protein
MLMSSLTADLLASLTDPTYLLGHITYALLILSMLMRDIAWLRAVAIIASIVKIFYRTFYVYDPVTVAWEVVFILVNLGQLALIWWENRPPRFTAEEQYFLAVTMPGAPSRLARKLLKRGKWHDAGAAEVLTTEDMPVMALMFVSEGRVRIEKAGRLVAECGRGDFVGEMSFISGAAATATAIAIEPTRYLAFERQALAKALRKEPMLRFAMQASFNRNLIDKLDKSSDQVAARPA